MPPFNDLTGLTYGRLTVLAPTRRRICGEQLVFWRCQCVCGAECYVKPWQLRSGGTRSCGCLQREAVRKTGMRNARHRRINSGEYTSWRGMLARCTNVNHPNWQHYGGRGIRVCARWRNSFLAFYSDMGPRPVGMTLDRIDPNGDYEPGNCRWVTWSAQRLNQRRMRAA